GSGGLVRGRLLRLGEEEHVLLLTMHHLVGDGWSMNVLQRELGRLYEAYEQGGESPLAELEVQYGDYAAWQREYLQGEVLEREVKYWRGELGGEGGGVLELPTDRVRPAVESHRGGVVKFEVGEEVSRKLRELSRREGATLFMTMLAGFQAWLMRVSGQGEIAVGTPVAGRTRREVEGLIGLFVNTLVIRSEVKGGERFVEL